MTSARVDLNGSMPFHDAAKAVCAPINVNANRPDVASISAQRKVEFAIGLIVLMMLIDAYDFAKGRTRSNASLKSASSGATFNALS